MASFELPANFAPDFHKDYKIHGNRFTIYVQTYGIIERRWTWAFGIDVKGNLVESGLFYWDPAKRDLTNENVCNHLATFWGPSAKIKEAQKLEPTFEYQLIELTEKCAEWMHAYFYTEDREHTDYDIVNKFMDNEGWVILLRPNYLANRLVEFYKPADAENVEVHSYIEDNELSIKL